MRPEEILKTQHPNTLLRWYGDALLWVANRLFRLAAPYATFYEWVPTELDCEEDESAHCNCRKEKPCQD